MISSFSDIYFYGLDFSTHLGLGISIIASKDICNFNVLVLCVCCRSLFFFNVEFQCRYHGSFENV